MKIFCRLGLAVALASASSGCSWLYREKFVEPLYDIRAKRVVVIPFAKGQTGSEQLWYYEYETGSQFGESVALMLSQSTHCDGLEVLRGSDVQHVVLEQSVENEVDWTVVAKAVNADFVITGSINDIASDDPHQTGLLAGSMVVSFQVWNGKTGQRDFARQIKAEFAESEAVYVEFEKSARKLRAGLMSDAAERIANLLCGHMEDTYPRP